MAVAWLDAACASSETVRARKEATTLASMRAALGELRRVTASSVAASVAASVADTTPATAVDAAPAPDALEASKEHAENKPPSVRAKRTRRKRA